MLSEFDNFAAATRAMKFVSLNPHVELVGTNSRVVAELLKRYELGKDRERQ